MKAVFLEKPFKLVVKEIPKPKCSSDQVLIQIKNVGLCGSDLHYYTKGKIGDHVVIQPHILGHESSGIISMVGKNVKDFKIGDRVSVEPGVPCGCCNYCKIGEYNLCDNIKFISVPPLRGAFAEYIAHDPNHVFSINKNVNFEEAALVEPLSVAYNAVMSAGIKPGDSVCILGAGSIGFACLEMSRVMGATQIIVSDLEEINLINAKAHKADKVINPTTTDIVEIADQYTYGKGFDYVVEASGSSDAISLTTKLVKKGGVVIWVGLGDETVQMSSFDVVRKAITIKGIYRYANTYSKIIKLLEAKKIDLKNWISHRFPLEKLDDAVKTALNPEVPSTKIMIYMDAKEQLSHEND